jgi:hypothetical protein
MIRKLKKLKPRRALTVGFPTFHPFEFVSDFGFRISDFPS